MYEGTVGVTVLKLRNNVCGETEKAVARTDKATFLEETEKNLSMEEQKNYFVKIQLYCEEKERHSKNTELPYGKEEKSHCMKIKE